MDELLSQINEPENYYFGLGERSQLEVWSVLLFVRRSKMTLQQEALQDRSHPVSYTHLTLPTKA